MLPIGRQLIDYLPEILKAHFAPLLEAEGPSFEEAWKRHVYALDEVFAATATDHGLKRFEKVLGLAPRLAASLEDRRLAVMAALMATLVITERTMAKLLGSLLGPEHFTYHLDHKAYRLKVVLKTKIRGKLDLVKEVLRERLPANLDIAVTIAYNTHNVLGGFTHNDLALFTQDQLRYESFKRSEYTTHEELVYTSHKLLEQMSHESIQTKKF